MGETPPSRPRAWSRSTGGPGRWTASTWRSGRHGLGLLGPNGAGKTTAVRVLATLLRPDGGRARVLGHDVVTEAAEVRRQIGLTGQYAALDEYLTGRANLIMIGQLSRLTASRPGGAPTRCSSGSA